MQRGTGTSQTTTGESDQQGGVFGIAGAGISDSSSESKGSDIQIDRTPQGSMATAQTTETTTGTQQGVQGTQQGRQAETKRDESETTKGGLLTVRRNTSPSLLPTTKPMRIRASFFIVSSSSCLFVVEDQCTLPRECSSPEGRVQSQDPGRRYRYSCDPCGDPDSSGPCNLSYS